MSQTFGLTAQGFLVKSQQQIISEIQTSIQAVFGQNVNFSPESNFGQLVGIFSEREALLWQLGLAIYNSQYPSGAEGVSVDNILALNNLRRKGSLPTKTAPISETQSNGITLYPLVLFGTPGTVIPAGSIIQTSASPPLQFSLDGTVTILASVDAIQNVFLSNIPTSGAFVLSIIDSFGETLTTPSIQWNALPAQSLLNFSGTPAGASSFKLILTRAGVPLTTGTISTPGTFPTSGAIQTAITALTGYSGVTVAGSAGSYTISWNGIANPAVTITANTTTVTITSTDSFQSAINNLFDATNVIYPYTDVTAIANASGYTALFGAMTPLAGQPSSGDQAQPLFVVVSNTLMMGLSVTNLLVSASAVGAPAEGLGAATCTVNGPNFVAAGSINAIGSPITGWSGVINQLDCITGSNAENDTQALVRRQNSLNANANGPLLAIIEKVQALPGVTQVIGFQNLNDAAIQTYSFAVPPVSGTYKLVVNGYVTGSIAFNATSGAVQTAIQALPGMSATLVDGDFTQGYSVDFNGSLGGQPLPLITPVSNTTGSAINVAFGRPGHSVEIVAEGGTDLEIAQAIQGSKPAGIQTFGNTGPILVFDAQNNQYQIFFSRPTPITIYIILTMITDTFNVPGNSGSGVNPLAKFSPTSIGTIQRDLVSIGNAFPIGGRVIGFGTEGLIGAFNAVPGIIEYTLFFGTSPNPTQNVNIDLLPEEVAIFETFNIAVSYS